MRLFTRLGLPAAIALGAFLTPTASAQTLETQATLLTAPVAQRSLVEQTIENFDKTTAEAFVNQITQPPPPDGPGGVGFTYGTNSYRFRVAQGFVLPAGMASARLIGFDIYFGNIAGTPVSQNYRIDVVGATSLATGPIEPAIYSQTFPISGIQVDDTQILPTSIRFTNPPIVTGTFFGSARFDQNVVGDSLAIIGTGNDVENTIDNTWIYYGATPRWRNVNTALTVQGVPVNVYLWWDAIIDNATAGETTAQGREVRLYGPQPNPNAGSTVLALSLDRSLPVHVKVYDVLGREVASVSEQTLGAGDQRVSLDTSSLQSGTYVYRVFAGEEMLTGRLTVIR